MEVIRRPMGRTDAVELGARTGQIDGVSAETIAHLHIVLNDFEPAISRRVDVPATASLKMARDIIQAAMGRENCHLWHVEAGDRRYGVPDPMRRRAV